MRTSKGDSSIKGVQQMLRVSDSIVRRGWIAFLSIVLLVSVVAHVAAKDIVTFAHPWASYPDYVGLYEQIVAQFNREHSDIELKLVELPGSGGDPAPRLVLACAGGVAPDVTILWGLADVASLHEAGITLDIRPYVSQSPLWNPKNQIMPYVETFNWRSGLIGLPAYAISTNSFYWHASLFDEVGYDRNQPPRNLQELLEYETRLRKTNADGTVSRFAFDPLETWQKEYSLPHWFGARLYDAENDVLTVRTEEMSNLAEWLRELYGRQGGYRAMRSLGKSTFSLMASGQLAMIQDNPHTVEYVVRANPDMVLGRDFMVGTPILSKDATRAGAIQGMDSTVVTASAPHTAAAVHVAIYLTFSPSAMRIVDQHKPGRLCASRPANMERIARQTDPRVKLLMKAQMEAVERTKPWPMFPELRKLGSPLLTGLKSIAAGEKAPVEVFQNIHDVVQPAIDARKAKSN
jgi:ABC-type glycerol-3-phosphate transport system substrate-binding protein